MAAIWPLVSPLSGQYRSFSGGLHRFVIPELYSHSMSSSRTEEGEALRSQYDFVRPGYYMNKRHWIAVDLVDEIPMDEVAELVDESYRLVFESLPKKRQAELRPQ